MHFLLSRLNHETNTFSPIPTPFSKFSPSFTSDAIAESRGANTGLGAFISFCDEKGITYDVPVCAMSFPSGPVTASAYSSFQSSILSAAAARPYDAVLLDLHGAMVTSTDDDGEGTLLSSLRQVLPATPIGVGL